MYPREIHVARSACGGRWRRRRRRIRADELRQSVRRVAVQAVKDTHRAVFRASSRVARMQSPAYVQGAKLPKAMHAGVAGAALERLTYARKRNYTGSKLIHAYAR